MGCQLRSACDILPGVATGRSQAECGVMLWELTHSKIYGLEGVGVERSITGTKASCAPETI